MNDCKKIHALLPLDVDGGLSPSDKALVDQHLEQCAEARHEMDQLIQMRLDLRNLPEPHLPHDLHSKIMGRLVNDERPVLVRPNFWARYSWVAAAAAVLAFIILNPFTGDRQTLLGPIAQKTDDEKFAMNTQSASSGKTGAEVSGRPASGVSGYAPSMPMGDSLSNQQFTMARKAKVSQPKMKKAPETKTGTAGASAVVGAVSEMPKPMVVASKPADKDQLETETFSKRMESSEVPAAPPAFSAAAPLAGKNLEEKGVKESRMADEKLSVQFSAAQASRPAEVSLDADLEPQDSSALSWSGANCPYKTENREWLSDEPAFHHYWETLLPGRTPPKVDFSKQAVVVLLAGEKPTAGYSISVTTWESQRDRVVVYYRVASPPPGTMVAQVLTRPWCLQVIPKPEKPVVFIKD